MKTAVFLCLPIFFSQIVNGLWEVALSNEEEECIESLSLKRDKIVYLYFRHNTAEDNPQLNNFIHCVWKAKSFQDESGSINYDKLKTEYDLSKRIGEDDPEYLNHQRELVSIAVEECQKKPPLQGGTAGETATKVQNCIVENYVKAKKDRQ